MEPLFRRITSSGKFIKYFTLEPNLEPLRKQLIFRSNNLGMKELDLLVGSWAKRFVPTLERPELERFYSEVLEKETPDLNKLLLSPEQDPTEKYLREIRSYARNASYSKQQL